VWEIGSLTSLVGIPEKLAILLWRITEAQCASAIDLLVQIICILGYLLESLDDCISIALLLRIDTEIGRELLVCPALEPGVGSLGLIATEMAGGVVLVCAELPAATSRPSSKSPRQGAPRAASQARGASPSAR
jgi:hypothetical protein